MFEGNMYAIFLMEPKRLATILALDEERASWRSRVKVTPHGNGSMSFAYGPIQEVMFLIGAVACEGENCLYKAECL